MLRAGMGDVMAKPFAWSFSKLKNVETCPRRHHEVDVLKNFQDNTEQLDWGNKVHEALAAAVRSGNPLPPEMATYQPYVDRYRGGNGAVHTELQLAITKTFQPAPWFAARPWEVAKGASSAVPWLRVVIDLLKVNGRYAIAADWKTGKIKVDSVQLMLNAAVIFAHYPDVFFVETHYVWLMEDATTRERYTRDDVATQWLSVLPRVQAYQERLMKNDFPPLPGKLCRSYCPVKTCEHNGKYQK